ncbi:hypothetical protein CIP107572_02344 [Corynebacterium diphtheriae]|nr:hypothetical protein CIP107572_02344 [Corynebacterium diphtheriae]
MALKVQKLLTLELLGQQGRENRLLQQGSKRVGGVTGVDPNAFGDFGSNGRFAQVSVDKREAPPGARSAAGEHEAAGVFYGAHADGGGVHGIDPTDRRPVSNFCTLRLQTRRTPPQKWRLRYKNCSHPDSHAHKNRPSNLAEPISRVVVT